MPTSNGSTDPQIVAYIVRHGTTDLNQGGKFRGPLDPPLDEQGFNDADKVGKYFEHIDLGFATRSDKLRTQQTASPTLDPKGITATADPNLRAWNVGYLAGKVKSEHQDEISYFQNNPDVQIPNGESLDEFRGRARSPLLGAIDKGIQSGVPSVVFGHSSIVKEVSNLVHGDHNKVAVYPGGIAGVTWDGNKLDFKALTKKKAVAEGFGQ
jgi:broad specificity phosphatase PhoE